MSSAIIILLALGGFGVQANPNAPTAQEVLKYAPDAADAMVYLDAQAVLPNNWKAFTELPDNPTIKADKELSKDLGGIVLMAKGQLEVVKGMAGFDPINDVHSVAAWMQYPAKGDPNVLVVVRGKFPADLLAKVPVDQLDGKAEKLDGRTWITLPDGKSVATTADGTIIFGTTAWVKERAGGKWKTKAAKKGSVTAGVSSWLDEKPFFFIASAPSATARSRWSKEAAGDDEAQVMLDMFTAHDFASISFRHDGLAWSWKARDAAGFDNAVMASEGVISLLRAGHHATRGIAQVVLATLGNFAKKDKTIAEVVKRRKELLAMVWDWSGDGNFQATVDKNAAQRTVTVRAKGKTLSEVAPLGGVLVPAGVAAYMMMGRTHVETAPVEVKSK